MTCASILLFLLALVPQRYVGWLRGKVTDKDTGAVIPNVEIFLSDADGRNVLQSQTNQSGDFVLAGISSGEYELTLRNHSIPNTGCAPSRFARNAGTW